MAAAVAALVRGVEAEHSIWSWLWLAGLAIWMLLQMVYKLVGGRAIIYHNLTGLTGFAVFGAYLLLVQLG